MLNPHKACSQLAKQGQSILSLASGLTMDEALWRQDPKTWSVLVVLCHLVDEEMLDFRAHLDHILNSPNDPWPEIDPVGWVTQKHYEARRLDETLENFRKEREKSLDWLAALQDWNGQAGVSQPWGTLNVGDMLASWLAHDLLHVRQLVELRYQITAMASQPYRIDYAGEW